VLVCPLVEPGCLYPEEVSTCVLAQLLADATRHTGRDVSKAVITVPAYFSDEQRDATVAAGASATSVVCYISSIRAYSLPVARCTPAQHIAALCVLVVLSALLLQVLLLHPCLFIRKRVLCCIACRQAGRA
jgi:hypothetical protein